MRVFYNFSLIQNRLQQISAKSLAIQFRSDQMQPCYTSPQFTTLVPVFFAHSTSFKFNELKDEFKVVTDQKSNTTSNTYLQLEIPLGSNEQLRQQFTKLSTKYLRIGRLLETLDAMVGIVAYRYCYGDFNKRSISVATQGVYNFLFFKNEFINNQDLVFNSYVTFAGRTSLEINCDIYQGGIAASVQFNMVSRDANDYKKSAPVPLHEIQSENEQISEIVAIRDEMGRQSYRKRIELSKASADPPTAEESLTLHKIFQNKRSCKTLDSTILEKNSLMHTQDRNLHGKIFGGHIMKEIVELGWLVGYKHTKGVTVEVIHIFDVLFHAPVPIGSTVKYQAKLCYTEDNFMIIQIVVNVFYYENAVETIQKTTEVYLAMKCSINVEEVLPVTYEEGIHYLHGKKLLQQLK